MKISISRIPFVPAELSKNKAFTVRRYGARAGIGKSQGSKDFQQELWYLIRGHVLSNGSSIQSLFKPKTKTWIGMVVHKKNPRFDAANVIDVLFDGIEKAIGVNDCYFAISRLDYVVDSTNYIELEISQEGSWQ